MTTVGRWSPNKVRARVLDGTWVSAEELGGMVLLEPTSIAYTGTSASIGTNGSVEFTAVSSLSLNGVFSADYDNYMIVGWNSSSGNSPITLRWRASGTDNTTASSYTSQYWFINGTSVVGARVTDSFSYVSATRATQRSGFTATAYGPYLAQPTALRSVLVDDYFSASVTDYASTHNQSTSYDGFSIFVGGGVSMTGLVSVYGLVGA